MRILWLLPAAALVCGCPESEPARIDGRAVQGSDADPSAEPDASGASDGSAQAALTPLSDEFGGAALDGSWSFHRGDRLSTSVTGGELRIVLERGHMGGADSSLWFNESQGSLVFKPITGDFIASAAVRVRRADPNADQLPASGVRLGGLMARDAAATGQSYLFIVTGFDVSQLAVETKTTVASASQFTGTPSFGNDVELRLCRVGATFRTYYRNHGAATWQLAPVPPPPNDPAPIVREDLPQTLQVGLVIYTNQATPDVQMFVDYLRLRRPQNAADCSQD